MSGTSVVGSQNITVTIDGNGNRVLISEKRHITFRRPPLRGIRTELDLLRSDSQSIPFLARQSDLALLHSWLSSDKPISILTVTGQGGAGKTRLALELLNQTQNDWAGGFASFGEPESIVQSPSQPEAGKPLLAIVDYASAHTDSLRQLLQNLARYDCPLSKLRILLLERTAEPDSGWYQRLFDYSDSSDTTSLFHQYHPHRLSPFDPVSAESVFNHTLTLSAKFHKASPVPEDIPDGIFADPKFADPVVLIMAALASWEGGITGALHCSRPDLATRLARREMSHIENRFPNDSGRRAHALQHLAAHSTLCGGFTEEQLVSVAKEECTELGLEYPGGPAALAADLVKCLPGSNPNGSGTIQPDIIGGAFLQLVMPKGVVRAARRSDIATAQALVRAVQDFRDPHAVRKNADPDTPQGKWPLDRLKELAAYATKCDLSLLRSLDASMPESTIELRELAADLSSRLLAQLPANLEPTSLLAAERARIANNLANRLSELGRPENALLAAAVALKHHRSLAQSQSDANLPGLATALNNFANRSNELGHHDDALAAAEEALLIRRGLAKSNQSAPLADLAMSLNNYAIVLSDADRRGEALEATLEATQIYRTLVDSSPGAFLADLAMSLSNCSNRLSAVGRREDALAAATESLKHCRTLAHTYPDAFLPSLGISLITYANRLSTVGRVEDALVATEEALQLYRALSKSNPDAFLPSLAIALNNYAAFLNRLKRHNEALKAATEGLDYHRSLVQSRPDLYLPKLAGTLNTYANMLISLGRRGEAYSAATEALEHYRALALRRPGVFLSDLASSLGSVGMMVDSAEDAVEVLAEAIRTLTPLFTSLPTAHASLMTQLCADYRARSKQAGIEPKSEVLGPLSKTFQRLIQGQLQ